MNILDYRKVIFSEKLGEDGILEFIFSKIDKSEGYNFNYLKPRFCIEFGAYDGIGISNTRNLIVNHNWSSFQIESNTIKAEECRKNFLGFPVKTINCSINCIDNLFDDVIATNDINQKISFLSIDVDGLDYEIFQTINTLPDVLCIEVSPDENPLSKIYNHPDIAKYNIGQSLTVMTELAQQKGYELICFTGNAFYVKKELYNLFDIKDNSPEIMYSNFWDIIEHSDKLIIKERCKKNNIINPFVERIL